MQVKYNLPFLMQQQVTLFFFQKIQQENVLTAKKGQDTKKSFNKGQDRKKI